jgi:CheY-like chemotaxis protein
MSTQAPNKMTILVVDDEVAYCDATAEILEVLGYRALKANGAREAKVILEVERPNAILLDVMMPEIDGLTLLAELAANPRFLGIPLVMVSAKAMPADIGTAWAAGADAYLCKPYTADELREVIQHVLAIPSTEPYHSGGTDRLRIILKSPPPDSKS